MPVLKALCPECDAKLRLTVDGEGDHEVECPKCGHDFTATLDAEEPPAKAGKKKPAKGDTTEKGTKEKAKARGDTTGKKAKAAKRRDDDDDDDEDDRPKKKRRKDDDEEAEGGKTKLIVAGAVAGVIALAALGGVIYAVTSKDKTAKNTDSPPAATQPVQLGPPPGPVPPPGNQQPNNTQPPNGTPGTNPVPGPGTNPNNGPKPPNNTNPGTSPGTGPSPGTNPNPGPKAKEPEEVELSTFLPPPPQIRISGSVAPTDKPVVRPPAIPPLAPDEDPFVRAKTFTPEGPLPTLPKLGDRNQRPLLTLEAGGHTDLIGKVFFAPKGDRIITVAQDKAVRIWDPATNETSKTIRFPAGPGKEGSLYAAAVARTGKHLAVAGFPVGTVTAGKIPIHFISPETGLESRKPLAVASGSVGCMHFSNDGKWLGVGCDNGAIQMVDVTNGIAYPAPGGRDDPPVVEVKFNPGSSQKFKKLAVLDAARVVQLWTFSTPPQRKVFGIRSAGRPTTLAWSNDGRTLAVGTTQGDIMIGTDDGQLIKSLPKLSYNGKPVQINQLQFLPGDSELAVAGVGGNAAGWAGIIHADTGKLRVEFKLHTNVIFALDVSADGKKIATSGGSRHETYVWSTENGKVLNRFAGSGNGVWSLAWAKDGKSLAWGTSNVRDENREGKLESTFRLDEFGVGNPPDPSKYTQMVTSDDHVNLKTLGNGILVKTPGRDFTPILLNDGEKVYSATVLPKGNAVAVAGVETLALVNPATAREIHKFIGHTGNVLCVTPAPDGKLFATGSSDQTIRIWHRDHDEPLLSIFVAGRDWIAWTPQGYYACSGQGERLIAWQIGAGAGKAPVVHPAERFRASMYQPAMLKYVVPAADLPRAMAMAQKYDKALVATTSVSDVLPPEVTLDGFGETEVKVDKDMLTVRAVAKSAKHPITAMRLLINGRPFQGPTGVKKFDNPQKDAEATWEVPLPPGTHTVAVIADSSVSKGMSKVGIAVRAGEIPKPNLYVLAMGVSDYPGKSKLNYCATDAEMLAKAFKERSTSVFAKIEVKILTDKQATKKGILDGMDWLKSKMTAQDVGIVSFSGHGMRDPFGQFYLVPIDFDPTDESCGTALSGKLFKDRLDNMPGRLVAILDACHSGVVAEKERPPAQADTLVRDLTAEDSGVIVMCASAGREYAAESKLTKAGFYTLGLVEGMAGHADIDGDGVVYIHELDIYATARVRQLSGGRQNPTLGRPATVRPFAIAKVDKPISP